MTRTTLHTALCITIRLGAVLMVVHMFEALPGLLQAAGHDFAGAAPSSGDAFLGTLLMGLLGLSLAAVLWLWPGVLASWASNRSRGETLASDLSAADLQQVALSVLGAWVAVTGVAGAISHLMDIVFLHERMLGAGTSWVPVSQWHWLFYYLAKALLGVGLLLGARGLVGGLRRVRGRSGASSDDAAATR